MKTPSAVRNLVLALTLACTGSALRAEPRQSAPPVIRGNHVTYSIWVCKGHAQFRWQQIPNSWKKPGENAFQPVNVVGPRSANPRVASIRQSGGEDGVVYIQPGGVGRTTVSYTLEKRPLPLDPPPPETVTVQIDIEVRDCPQPTPGGSPRPPPGGPPPPLDGPHGVPFEPRPESPPGSGHGAGTPTHRQTNCPPCRELAKELNDAVDRRASRQLIDTLAKALTACEKKCAEPRTTTGEDELIHDFGGTQPAGEPIRVMDGPAGPPLIGEGLRHAVDRPREPRHRKPAPPSDTGTATPPAGGGATSPPPGETTTRPPCRCPQCPCSPCRGACP